MSASESDASEQSAARGREHRALLIAMAAAFAVAMTAASADSFWVDEGSTAFKATRPTLSAWWQAMLWERNSNMQLPFYHLVVWVWEKVFGAGERMLRLANAPFLLLAIYGLWVAFRRDPGRFAFSVAFVLTNAFVWFYLNDARPYITLLGGAMLLFATVYRLKEDPSGLTAGWVWLFTGASLLVCATSMIAVPWPACAFCAAWYVRGRRFPLELVRCAPLASVFLLAGLGAIGGYYLWSLKAGADVPSLGGTGFANVVFAGYDLFGFSGLGPSRNVMRVELLRAFHGFYIPLGLFGVVWLLAIARVLLRNRNRVSRKGIVFYAILLAAAVMVILAGYLHGVRVLPRYLTPALPLIVCLGSYLGAVLWREGGWTRGLALALLACGLASSLQIRFAARHAKDDYRSAVAVTKEIVGSGKRVYWVADKWTAIHYGLLREQERETGSPQVILYLAKRPEVAVPAVDVVVLSKPDIYDSSGVILDLLRREGFRPAERFESFQVWRKP